MLKLIGKYKSVLLFILTFLGTYFVLSLVYGLYLKQAKSQVLYPDYLTHQVAQHSSALINFLGYDAHIEPFPGEASAKLMVEGHFLIRVVEGCNSMSVIILFCAFVLAFFNGWAKTLIFIALGSLAIYLINIIRIVSLALAVYEYPQYTSFMHQIAFPVAIYGFVFLLWVLWVNNFKRRERA